MNPFMISLALNQQIDVSNLLEVDQIHRSLTLSRHLGHISQQRHQQPQIIMTQL